MKCIDVSCVMNHSLLFFLSGNIAKNKKDFGKEVEADTCCFIHDHCEGAVVSGAKKNNFINTTPFTINKCSCDEKWDTVGFQIWIWDYSFNFHNLTSNFLSFFMLNWLFIMLYLLCVYVACVIVDDSGFLTSFFFQNKNKNLIWNWYECVRVRNDLVCSIHVLFRSV